MSDVRELKKKGSQAGQEQGAQPGQGGQHGGSGHAASDQISFYDESLKKQVQGSFKSDGKSIHVSSAYGVKSAPYGELGACIDYNSQVLLAQKLLSEVARNAESGTKDAQQRTGGGQQKEQTAKRR